MADRSPGVAQLKAFQVMADNSEQASQGGRLKTAAGGYTLQRQPIQKKENNTGLPGNLKSGIENLSGFSMDDVRVHYNSDKPAQLQAHAYAQGTDIHLGPGQEKHLAHEAWHVVQQKQGRVEATMQMKGEININDDEGLEHEADVMGNLALNTPQAGDIQEAGAVNSKALSTHASPVQRIRIKLDHAYDAIMNNVRAARVPKPGTKEVDGFKDYDPNHRPIQNDENIVLEGHGTYLKSKHKEGDPYDSQAELTPEQLANIAHMIPKSPGWHGQIILFGCATGPLTMEVSRHYLALSGKSVNVVGTLADIRMEVPDGGQHKEHRAEYDKQEGAYPTAPVRSTSARTQLRLWMTEGNIGAMSALNAIKLFEKTDERARGNGRAILATALNHTLLNFTIANAMKINYEGITYSKDLSSAYDIAMITEMLRVAKQEIEVFILALNTPTIELGYVDNKAVEYRIFFEQLLKELSVLKNLADISEESFPKGVVDWEGENVVNSKAEEAHGLSGTAMSKKDLISKEWGKRGGGQMLMMTHQPLENESDFL